MGEGNSVSRVIPNLTAADLERFWSHVIHGSHWWLWMGMRHRDGYGIFRLNGSTYRVLRVMYSIHYGVDPGEMVVLSTCKKPGCINPEHLKLAIATKENTAQGIRETTAFDRLRKQLAIKLGPQKEIK